MRKISLENTNEDAVARRSVILVDFGPSMDSRKETEKILLDSLA